MENRIGEQYLEIKVEYEQELGRALTNEEKDFILWLAIRLTREQQIRVYYIDNNKGKGTF